ncbi:MAG: ABC transporter permease [Gemmatimonadales bacterium]|nr:ABC transporter permease [Gemmatimonadota bacterium]MCL4213803.1 ABC transporter permease [Gemmatimonadales bacterium]
MRLGFLEPYKENLAVAMQALRVAKLRSALTILGVVIGVATVMTMASLVEGLRSQIISTVEIAGPSTFYVVKVYSSTPINPDNPPAWVRIRPDLAEAEAEIIADLPEVKYAALWGQSAARLSYLGERTQLTGIFGADAGFSEIQGGGLVEGRWFTSAEVRGGASVVVVQEAMARRLFGRINPIGKTIQVAGRPMEVIGLYEPPENIFAPPGSETGAIMPFKLLDAQFRIDKTNALFIPVKPREGVPVAQAQEAVTIAMRERRGLRPAQQNSFDLITQEQILDVFNQLTGVFFLVMIVLASVALLVGGIGVMAIMMVSVTDRTREIGLRKAVGASRGDILVQFLIEASTLTGVGGLLGIVVGLGAGQVVTRLLGIDASPPVGLTLIAVAVSVGIGIVFGVLPARRAAYLDPIEALHYE